MPSCTLSVDVWAWRGLRVAKRFISQAGSAEVLGLQWLSPFSHSSVATRQLS